MKAPRPAVTIAALLAAAALAVAGHASAGYTTQSSGTKVVHVFDSPNGVEVLVFVNDTLDSNHANRFGFIITGSNSTVLRDYVIEIALSPDDPDVRVAWHATATIGPGTSADDGAVLIPAEQPSGTLANAPFRFSLKSPAGVLIDSTEVSIDVRYHSPPADGGLLQLALATTGFWALVFLYALHLHSNERKLRARADALERSLQGAHPDDPAQGPKR